MCSADTGVLGQVWFDHDSPTAFPDFNTKHKCKNFDDISRWAVEQQVRIPLCSEMFGLSVGLVTNTAVYI